MPNGLAFYEDELDPENNLTFGDDSIQNPFRITVDGIVGGCIVKKVYLHNDNPDYYYTQIQVSVYDSSAGAQYSSSGWEWKLINSEYEPVPEQWDQVAVGNILSISDIGISSRGNTSDFIPVWIRCVIPAGLLADNITDLALRISATLNLVG